MSRSSSRSLDFDDKLILSRLTSRQRTTAEASFRQPYYCAGGSCSVPFNWESQPGTPKHPLSHSPPPPLTPPPSYHRGSPAISAKKGFGNYRILNSVLRLRKSGADSPPSSTSSSSFSSYSHSVPSTPLDGRRNGRSRSDPRSRMAISDYSDSPTSTLCLGGRRNEVRLIDGYHWPVKCLKKMVNAMGSRKKGRDF
ncbi:hypothetical protein M569_13729 [Genlisea aurea]|uniref:Uncharacterized protein n=1 Tax=Genlisea aurea TaxID=192259 RepID=S8C9M8_9LAMI|nr:hypothetical protein M569_13729 [Genlisea aurea]